MAPKRTASRSPPRGPKADGYDYLRRSESRRSSSDSVKLVSNNKSSADTDMIDSDDRLARSPLKSNSITTPRDSSRQLVTLLPPNTLPTPESPALPQEDMNWRRDLISSLKDGILAHNQLAKAESDKNTIKEEIKKRGSLLAQDADRRKGLESKLADAEAVHRNAEAKLKESDKQSEDALQKLFDRASAKVEERAQDELKKQKQEYDEGFDKKLKIFEETLQNHLTITKDVKQDFTQMLEKKTSEWQAWSREAEIKIIQMQENQNGIDARQTELLSTLNSLQSRLEVNENKAGGLENNYQSLKSHYDNLNEKTAKAHENHGRNAQQLHDGLQNIRRDLHDQIETEVSAQVDIQLERSDIGYFSQNLDSVSDRLSAVENELSTDIKNDRLPSTTLVLPGTINQRIMKLEKQTASLSNESRNIPPQNDVSSENFNALEKRIDACCSTLEFLNDRYNHLTTEDLYKNILNYFHSQPQLQRSGYNTLSNYQQNLQIQENMLAPNRPASSINALTNTQNAPNGHVETKLINLEQFCRMQFTAVQNEIITLQRDISRIQELARETNRDVKEGLERGLQPLRARLDTTVGDIQQLKNHISQHQFALHKTTDSPRSVPQTPHTSTVDNNSGVNVERPTSSSSFDWAGTQSRRKTTKSPAPNPDLSKRHNAVSARSPEITMMESAVPAKHPNLQMKSSGQEQSPSRSFIPHISLSSSSSSSSSSSPVDTNALVSGHARSSQTQRGSNIIKNSNTRIIPESPPPP